MYPGDRSKVIILDKVTKKGITEKVILEQLPVMPWWRGNTQKKKIKTYSEGKEKGKVKKNKVTK